MTRWGRAAALAAVLATALALPAHAFEAELSGRFGDSQTGGILVLGQTNLPDGLKLTVTVAGDTYRGKQIVAVEDGRFRAGPYRTSSAGLPPGAYRLVIDAGTAAGQPAEVREKIGANWVSVTSADLVTDEEGRRRLIREVDFTVD